MSQMNFLKLQTDLTNFGLNPTEWTIQKIRSTLFRVQNNSDQSFSFVGQLEYHNRRPRWKKLILISL